MISTEGEIGVGKDIENIVGAVKELQDEIGIYLVDVTKDFIGYIEELNKPENLNNLKKDIDDVLGSMGDVAGAAGTVIGKIGENRGSSLCFAGKGKADSPRNDIMSGDGPATLLFFP